MYFVICLVTFFAFMINPSSASDRELIGSFDHSDFKAVLQRNLDHILVYRAGMQEVNKKGQNILDNNNLEKMPSEPQGVELLRTEVLPVVKRLLELSGTVLNNLGQDILTQQNKDKRNPKNNKENKVNQYLVQLRNHFNTKFRKSNSINDYLRQSIHMSEVIYNFGFRVCDFNNFHEYSSIFLKMAMNLYTQASLKQTVLDSGVQIPVAPSDRAQNHPKKWKTDLKFSDPSVQYLKKLLPDQYSEIIEQIVNVKDTDKIHNRIYLSGRNNRKDSTILLKYREDFDKWFLENIFFEIDGNQTKIYGLQASEGDNLPEQLAAQKAENLVLEEKIIKLANLLKKKNNSGKTKGTTKGLSKLNNKIKKRDNRIEKLSSEKTALEKELNEAKTKVSNNETTISKKNTEIKKLTSEKEDTENKLNKAQSEQNKTIATLNEKIKSLNSEIAQMQEKGNTSQEEFQKKLNKANAELSNNKTTISEKNTEIANLTSDKEGLQKELDDANTQISNDKTTISEQNTKIEKLTLENEKRQEKFIKWESERLSSLYKRLGELEKELGQARVENAARNFHLSHLFNFANQPYPYSSNGGVGAHPQSLPHGVVLNHGSPVFIPQAYSAYDPQSENGQNNGSNFHNSENK